VSTVARHRNKKLTVVDRVRGRAGRDAGREMADRAREAAAKLTTDLKGGQIRFRLVATYLVLTAVLLGMLLRVGYLQTVGASSYRDASLGQRTRVNTVFAERGSILDRNGFELAIPVPTRTVFADPREVVDPIGTARALAGILMLAPEDEAALALRLQDPTSSFTFIARQADRELASTIMSLDLPGIGSYIEQSRSLTSSNLRALVGRTDPDGNGIAGLEKQFDDVLRGVDGKSVREVNSAGQSIASASNRSVPAIPGEDLILTIDRNIQYQVDGILTQQVARVNAVSGTAIVMDSKTGEIYALSTIRKNEDGSFSADSGNFAAVEAYEPGSVAKVFSVSSALNEGRVESNSVFSVPGQQTFDAGTRWAVTIKDAYPHPLEKMTVRKILVDSSNLGTVQIAQTMTPEERYEYLRAFGFGSRTAVSFPGESKGILGTPDKWRGTEKFTNSYGYGYATTALQLVAGVNVVANGGTYVAPRLVAGSIDTNGINVPADASATREVISPATAATMRSLLSDVVCFGTAKLAKVQGMTVAGKTGTGYKRQENGTYLKDDGSRAYFASFVGFLPAADPRFTVLVSIDEPDPSSRDRFGGTAAAPVFANIAQVLISELDIRPVADDRGCPAERPAELGPAH
jgi:cell division protein FtsI (penicillin-binding protein 3)